jgi:hypothetical protein
MFKKYKNNKFSNIKNFFPISDIKIIKTILHRQMSPFYVVEISIIYPYNFIQIYVEIRYRKYRHDNIQVLIFYDL